MNKNMIIAVVLCSLLFGVYLALRYFFFTEPEDRKSADIKNQTTLISKQNNQSTSGNNLKDSTTITSKTNVDNSTPNNELPIDKTKTEASKKEVKEEIFKVKTDLYDIQITNKDAVFKDIKFTKYKGYDGKIESAITNKDALIKPLKVSFGSAKYEDKLPVYMFEYDKKNSTRLKKIFYTEIKDERGNNFKLTKEIQFYKDKYFFDVKISLESLQNKECIFLLQEDRRKSFYLHWTEGLGPNPNPDSGTFYNYDMNRINVVDMIKNEVIYDDEIDDLQDDLKQPTNDIKNVKWIGIDNRYYFVAFIPDYKNKGLPVESAEVVFDPTKLNRRQITYEKASEASVSTFGLAFQSHQFTGNESASNRVRVYLGPKKRDLLKDLNNDELNPKLELITERSAVPVLGALVTWISIGFEYIIYLLFNLVGNFGVAIILVTVLLKIIMHPLISKSLRSSQKMQTMQPKIKEINEKFKDNPQLKQQEMFALYKREKFNPMGGCLPLVFQMPIFYALFILLPYMVDLRGANFLWIEHLSEPDTILLIDFWPHQINILPIIMTLTSISQFTFMSMNPQSSAGQQKIIMYLMPVFFLFLFYYMPAGLTLYWTVQNILQMGHQYIIKKMNPPDKNVSSKKDENPKRGGGKGKSKKRSK